MNRVTKKRQINARHDNAASENNDSSSSSSTSYAKESKMFTDSFYKNLTDTINNENISKISPSQFMKS